MLNRTSPGGFALIELIVAIAVSGLILLAARSMIEGMAEAASALSSVASAGTYDANAQQLMYAAIRNTEAASLTPGAVHGTADNLMLRTWCDVPAGWQERCVVRLWFSPGKTTGTLMADLNGTRVVLRRGIINGSFIYLVDARSGGTWTPAWVSEITTPEAIGVIIDGDTLFARIGERG